MPCLRAEDLQVLRLSWRSSCCRVSTPARRQILATHLILPALFANAINLKSVPGGRVIVASPYLFLQLVDVMGKKLYRAAALGANHVVVTAAIVLMLVARDAVVEGDFAGQSAFREQLESAVNRGIANSRVLFLHKTVQLVRGKMVPSFQKGAQNSVPLRRLLQADTLQMLVQDFLSLAHHLARYGRPVIDALLQHETSG